MADAECLSRCPREPTGTTRRIACSTATMQDPGSGPALRLVNGLTAPSRHDVGGNHPDFHARRASPPGIPTTSHRGGSGRLCGDWFAALGIHVGMYGHTVGSYWAAIGSRRPRCGPPGRHAAGTGPAARRPLPLMTWIPLASKPLRLIPEWPQPRRAAASGGARFLGVWSGGRLEGDLVYEGFEFGDQPAGFPVGVETVGEEVGTQLVVGDAAGQNMPDDDQQWCGRPG